MTLVSSALYLLEYHKWAENSADANPTVTITALVGDMLGGGDGGDGSAAGTIEGRDTDNEVVGIAVAIYNFATTS
jgi:hypothetical protein